MRYKKKTFSIFPPKRREVAGMGHLGIPHIFQQAVMVFLAPYLQTWQCCMSQHQTLTRCNHDT